ncbi:DinB family protein [Paenibacillus antarcticus]|nr:DinB family protein [Paenibacillus antarcticus]
MYEEMILTPIFNQLNIAIQSLIHMSEQFTEEELSITPIMNKRSVLEVFSHIAVICRADYLISCEATMDEMSEFYKHNEPIILPDICRHLGENFQYLKEVYAEYTHEELHEIKTSYWGVSYSRYEWLLEIVAHVYHHRGQLHSMLTQNVRDPKVPLFE